MPSEMTNFFEKQREMNLEQRKSQRDAMEFLHKYRADEQLVLDTIRRRDSDPPPRRHPDATAASAPAYATMSEIGQFIRETRCFLSGNDDRSLSVENLSSFRSQDALLQCSSGESQGNRTSSEVNPTENIAKCAKNEGDDSNYNKGDARQGNTSTCIQNVLVERLNVLPIRPASAQKNGLSPTRSAERQQTASSGSDFLRRRMDLEKRMVEAINVPLPDSPGNSEQKVISLDCAVHNHENSSEGILFRTPSAMNPFATSPIVNFSEAQPTLYPVTGSTKTPANSAAENSNDNLSDDQAEPHIYDNDSASPPREGMSEKIQSGAVPDISSDALCVSTISAPYEVSPESSPFQSVLRSPNNGALFTIDEVEIRAVKVSELGRSEEHPDMTSELNGVAGLSVNNEASPSEIQHSEGEDSFILKESKDGNSKVLSLSRELDLCDHVTTEEALKEPDSGKNATDVQEEDLISSVPTVASDIIMLRGRSADDLVSRTDSLKSNQVEDTVPFDENSGSDDIEATLANGETCISVQCSSSNSGNNFSIHSIKSQSYAESIEPTLSGNIEIISSSTSEARGDDDDAVKSAESPSQSQCVLYGDGTGQVFSNLSAAANDDGPDGKILTDDLEGHGKVDADVNFGDNIVSIASQRDGDSKGMIQIENRTTNPSASCEDESDFMEADSMDVVSCPSGWNENGAFEFIEPCSLSTEAVEKIEPSVKNDYDDEKLVIEGRLRAHPNDSEDGTQQAHGGLSTTQEPAGIDEAVSVAEELLGQSQQVTDTRSFNVCEGGIQQAQGEALSTTQESEGLNEAVSVTEELLDQAPAVTETTFSDACEGDTQLAQKEWLSTTQESEGLNEAVSVTEELLDQAPAVTETTFSDACEGDTQQAQKEWLSTTQESEGLNEAVSVTEELLDQTPAVTETRSSNACDDDTQQAPKEWLSTTQLNEAVSVTEELLDQAPARTDPMSPSTLVSPAKTTSIGNDFTDLQNESIEPDHQLDDALRDNFKHGHEPSAKSKKEKCSSVPPMELIKKEEPGQILKEGGSSTLEVIEKLEAVEISTVIGDSPEKLPLASASTETDGKIEEGSMMDCVSSFSEKKGEQDSLPSASGSFDSPQWLFGTLKPRNTDSIASAPMARRESRIAVPTVSHVKQSHLVNKLEFSPISCKAASIEQEKPKKSLKRVPLYIRRPIMKPKKVPGEICSLKYIPNLHKKKAGCERCLYWASKEEKEKFETLGRHLRIMMVRGGCDRGCAIFPREKDEFPVRLCKKCYYDTHKEEPNPVEFDEVKLRFHQC